MPEKVSLLAFGSETNTTFSFLKSDKLYTSSVYSDLTVPEVYDQYVRDIYQIIYKNRIKALVCDLHPDYLSSQFAQSLLKKDPGYLIFPVQHHFAHIHSVLYEHEINDPVIAYAFDGTGYGLDGHSWGGEIFYYDNKEYSRKYHFQYLPQPGGDQAVKEPWRMALSCLKASFPGKETVLPAFSKRIGENRIRSILDLIEKGINVPLTSSTGRLFDAVASILGLCDYLEYPAQGPLLLEKIADNSVKETYNFEIKDNEIIILSVIRSIIQDINNRIPAAVISAKFHNSLALIIFQTAKRLNQEYQTGKAVFSGGCFLNKLLCSRILEYFQETDIKTYFNKKVPASDYNISIGQVHYAFQRLFPASASKLIS